MSKNEDLNVTIPKSLVNKLRSNMKGTNFTSLTSFVIHLIRKSLNELEETNEEEQPYTKDEEEKIKKRLRDLGYID